MTLMMQMGMGVQVPAKKKLGSIVHHQFVRKFLEMDLLLEAKNVMIIIRFPLMDALMGNLT